MASPNTTAGPFQTIYAGHLDDTDPLTSIQLTSTGNFTFVEETPRQEWFQCTQSWEQSGARTIALEMAFMSNDETAVRLARGLALDATDPWGTVTNQKYVVLLVDADPDSDQNFLFPCLESNGKLEIVRGKTVQSQTPLGFRWQDPDLDFQLVIGGTRSELGTILGAQNPF